jgi:hypothetical protein
MKKLAIPLAVAAIAVLGACSTTDPVHPAPAPVVYAPAPAVVAAPPPGTVVVQPQAAAPMVVPQPTAIRAGVGRVESIHPTGVSQAAAGGTTKPMKRLGIKMNDGTVQYVDTVADVSIGQRIELTRDGHLRH